MCLRVTIVVPSSSKIKAIIEIAKEYGFSFDIVNNKSILEQISENEIYLGNIENGCECYTGIGAFDLYNRNIDDILEKFENKDLINQMREEDMQKKKAYKDEAKKWLSLLRNLIDNNYVSRLGILLHFYHDATDKEEIILKDKIFLKLTEVEPECLMKIKNDIIYYFE